MSWHHDNRKHDEVTEMIGTTYTVMTSVKDTPLTLIESGTGTLFVEEVCVPIDVVEIMSSLQNRKRRGKIM